MLHRLNKPLIAGIWLAVFLAGVAAGWFGYDRQHTQKRADLLADAQRCAAAFDPANLAQLSGTRDDLATPSYQSVKHRLMRLRAVNAATRYVYLFRSVPETGKVIFLGDSAPPGAKDESLPGDDYPEAPRSPGLQEIVLTGRPAIEGPLADSFGTWVTGYAVAAEAPSTKPGLPRRDLVGMDLAAGDWSRALWSAAALHATYTWTLLGLPFVALLMLRRQVLQREAIRNLSAAMEQSHSALMIVDLESCIEYANTGLCRQMGYSRRELIGRNWRDFRVPETSEDLLATLVATVRAGHAWEGEWFNRRKDGTVYPVHGIVTPVKERNGSIACFIAIFDDVTDAKRKEAELLDARDLAQAGDRAKGQFLATMSHEVRTPLNGIVGFTNLLLGTPLTDEQRDYAETIRSSSEALISLTGDILDYARIESGKLKLDQQPCDPRECIEEVFDLFAARATEKKISLLHRCADDVPAAIVTDAGRLRQALGNLVNNAVKFTDAGEIEVSLSCLPPAEPKTPPPGATVQPRATPPTGVAESITLQFSVRDTGVGIPADLREHLFRPFSQLDSTTTRKHGGAGLGLAICKNLVHLLGGKITLESEVGRGSTFSFTIVASLAVPAESVPDLGGLRLGLVGPPGPLRRELAELAAHWQARVTEADQPVALRDAPWETAFVDLDEAAARALADGSAPALGLPQRKTNALVPMSLPSDLRTALRTHFHLLINKPVHHGAFLAHLQGVRPAAPLPEPPPPHFGLHVLLVEDNVTNQRLMQRILTRLGCTWTAVDNGRLALDALAPEDSNFDLVLLDLHMPEIDGLGVVQRLRSGQVGVRLQSIWIVVLTADVRLEQRARLMSAGANHFLTKPLQLRELEACFRQYREARNAVKP